MNVDVTLDAGCRVADLRQGGPEVHGPMRLWTRFDRTTGARALSLRILEIAPGLSPGLSNEDCDEVLYVIEGTGTAYLDGYAFAIGPDAGIHLRPGVSLALENPGPHPLTLASARCPDDGTPGIFEAARVRPKEGSSAPPPTAVARLDDCPAEAASDGRSFQVLIDASGSGAPVTEFVGSIPPGRAPDHFHEYEEVLVVLQGRGPVGTTPPSGPAPASFYPAGRSTASRTSGRNRCA
jgi:mannose-6-phosphate isomerase-like protein (cupin superfamily)